MEDEIAEIVREHGWFAASISDHDPPFLYSIGDMHVLDYRWCRDRRDSRSIYLLARPARLGLRWQG